MIDIEDVRKRNHYSILNTATGKHLDAALTELETLREALRELHDFAEGSKHHRYAERSAKAFDRAAELLGDSSAKTET